MKETEMNDAPVMLIKIEKAVTFAAGDTLIASNGKILGVMAPFDDPAPSLVALDVLAASPASPVTKASNSAHPAKVHKPKAVAPVTSADITRAAIDIIREFGPIRAHDIGNKLNLDTRGRANLSQRLLIIKKNGAIIASRKGATMAYSLPATAS